MRNPHSSVDLLLILLSLMSYAVMSETCATASGPSTMSPITTHVLDTSTGRPGAGVPLTLSMLSGEAWDVMARGITNSDGRYPNLITQDQFQNATYKMRFDTATYFQNNNIEGFYPFVEVVFEIKDCSQHYHIPLLISPFGYSTYRGS